MDFKTAPFAPAAVKEDGDKGVVDGYASIFDTEDEGHDIVHRGAFERTLKERGEKIVYLPPHDWRAHIGSIPGVPLVIREDEKGLFTSTKFFLDTTAGKDAFAVIRSYHEAGRPFGMSFGFEPRTYDFTEDDSDSDHRVRHLHDLELFEYGHVPIPMHDDARVVDVKGYDDKAAIASHSTATTDIAWSAATAKRNLKADADPDYYASAHAWKDPEGDPRTKGAYRFIHHMIGADGKVGAANLRACSASIAVLNGGRGGTTIPEANRRGVWRHAAKHLKDADREPPELRSRDALDGLTFGEDMELTEGSLVELAEFVERAKSLVNLRATDGRDLKHRERLVELVDHLSATTQDAQAMLKEAPPADVSDGAALFALFQRTRRTLADAGIRED